MKNPFRSLAQFFDRTRGTPAPSGRPDISDLIGPHYDVASAPRVRKTLIVCSARRTGSHELSRLLLAAGLGVPHEYFNRSYAEKLWERWGFEGDPLDEKRLRTYIRTLHKRRSKDGLFTFKLQLLQFDRFLRNAHGEALFRRASIVHLFRPDIAGQFVSLRKAELSGRWDFSDYISTDPKKDSVTGALKSLDVLVEEDAGLRRIFALLGIKPLFITTDELANEPFDVVKRIAALVGRPIDEPALRDMIAGSGPYPRRDFSNRHIIGANGTLQRHAFKKLEP